MHCWCSEIDKFWPCWPWQVKCRPRFEQLWTKCGFGLSESFAVSAVGLRIAKAFGHGDLNQKCAETIRRIYSSVTFGRTEGHCGEARLHKRVAAAGDLAVNCEVSFCDVPIKVLNEQFQPVCKIVPWPLIRPSNLFPAMVDQGWLSMLHGDDGERHTYWCNMQALYPDMSGIQAATAFPLAIYGEECNAFRQSVMALHWQAILNPYSTNSEASCYLIAMVPSQHNWIAHCL